MSLSDSPNGFEIRDPRDDDSVSTFMFSLQDVLSFATGATTIPPLGFIPMPCLQFDDTHLFPRANTCANTLYLPLQIENVSDFIFYMSFGISNTAGFGRV